MQDYNLVPLRYNSVATILSGQTDSSAVTTDWQNNTGMMAVPAYATTVMGVYLPAEYDGGALSILASHDDITYFPMYNPDMGGDQSFLAAASKYIPFPPTLTAGIKYLKLRSDVNQTQDAALTLVLRRVL